jgi:hypothetical protein
MTLSILPGFNVSESDSKTETTLLDDNTPVPAGSMFLAGCAFDAASRAAYIALWPAGGTANQTVQYIGGKAVRGDGAQLVLTGGAIAAYLNGLPYTSRGELVFDGTAPDQFPNGIGATSAGGASLG